VGAGLAAKRDGEKSVAVAYFGDGACEEGVLHESLNLAQVMQLPVIFVCENNLYSSHMDMHLRQPSNSVSRFAEAHKMNSYLLDGNDVVKVATFAEKAIRRARNGDGPSFVEAVTFRWRGHVGPEMDLDVGVKRSAEELAAWMQLDPLKRIEDALRKNRNCEDGVFEEIKLAVDKSIEENLSLARAAEDPNLENLLGFVYEKN
jgi:pyruvate dehydrogenase E1 component alpha subunit